MATTHTLEGDLSALLAGVPVSKITRARIVTNLPAGTALIDTAGKTVHLGDGVLDVDRTTGEWTAELIATDATDLNIVAGTLRYELRVEYSHGRHSGTWSSGWFELTAAADIANPGFLDDADPIAVESASSYATEAAASAALARDISNIDTSDAAIDTALQLPDGLAAARLTATYATVAAVTSRALTANRPVNLLDISVDNTGATDVAAALNGVDGRQVDVPPGSYRIDSPVTLPAGATLRCEPGVTFVAGAAFAASTPVFKVLSSGAGIFGSPVIDAANLAYWCLEVAANDFRSDGVTLKNSLSHGAYLHGASDVEMDRLHAIDCGSATDATSVGVYASGCTRLKLSNSHAQGSYLQGFYLAGAGTGTACQLSNISASGNGGAGVDLRIPGSTVVGVTATNNTGAGFALNAESTGVRSTSVVVVGVDCYANNHVASSPAEVSLTSVERVTLVGVNAYSTSLQYGLRLNDVLDARISGVQAIGAHAGYVSGFVIPSHATGCTDIDISGSTFDNGGAGSHVMTISGAVSGLRVSNSVIKGAGFGVAYVGPNAINNADFRFGNNWGSIAVANYFRELSAPTGSGRLPASAPAAATGTDATTINTIRTDLINAGFYK